MGIYDRRAGSDIINDLDVDLSGNIYITGSFNTAAEFRGTEATSFSNTSSFGGDDIFYAKYDVDGKFQWLHEDGGASNDAGVRVEIVNSNVVVAGEYESAGLTEIAGVTPAIYGGVDVCLVGLDLNGAVLWNADGGSNGIDWAGGLAGEGDSIYIAVNFLGLSMTYTDFGLNATGAQMNLHSGFSDISVCSFGATSGLYGWVEQIQGISDEYCYDMIANSTDLILCGSYNGTIFLPPLGSDLQRCHMMLLHWQWTTITAPVRGFAQSKQRALLMRVQPVLNLTKPAILLLVASSKASLT